MLKTHKFQIGQTVYFTSRLVGPYGRPMTPTGSCSCFPRMVEDYQYRIKSANEAFERVAEGESNLIELLTTGAQKRAADGPCGLACSSWAVA